MIYTGYSQVYITPALDRPVYLAGFGPNRRAETVHDDLYCRALSIQSQNVTVVLVSLDLIGFFRQDVLGILKHLTAHSEVFRDLHPYVLLASSHTHHGPDTIGLWGPNFRTRGVDAAYLETLKARIGAAILASLESLTAAVNRASPARVKWASLPVPGVAKNARNPEIVDYELTLLQWVNADGQPLATLCNFPCHPEVLWMHNPHITSDYVHFLRAEVEARTSAPCLFFAGALGGMMTPDVAEHTFAAAEGMGKRLAAAGLEALAGALPQAQAPLRFVKRTFKARVTNPLYRFAFWSKVLPDTRDRAGQVESEANLVQIGDCWFISVPGELLPKLGLRLKRSLAAAGARVSGVIGLANDELGYILPPEDFKFPLNPFKPGSHYEETNSTGIDIGRKLMDAVQQLLNESP